MKHTEFGHSITFISQNLKTYPDINSGTQNKITMNTWESWHLIPESRPTLPLPKQKTKTIDSIPNTNGQIDLSLTDIPYPVFENREGTFTFIYNPIYSQAYGDYKSWIALYTEMASFLHGRELRMVLEDDPGYYWEGRFSLESWESNNDGSGSTVTIGYSVYPFKRTLWSSIQEWLWDPFNFYNDIIPDGRFKDISIITNSNYFGFAPESVLGSKNNISKNDSRWNKIKLSNTVGTEPVYPIIWWKPSGIDETSTSPYGQKTNYHRLLIVWYVNRLYNIDYFSLVNKYKYYDPKDIYNDSAVQLIEANKNGSEWYKFIDKDLIFCDAFTKDDQFISFIGTGEIKIEFRRGVL